VYFFPFIVPSFDPFPIYEMDQNRGVRSLGTFAYLLLTEVLERWTSTLGHWAVLRNKTEQARSPEELESRRRLLAEEHAFISKEIRTRSGRFEQNPVGAVEFLNARAKESRVRIVSMVPAPVTRKGQTELMPVSAVVVGEYHQIGTFVNNLESGGICFQVRKLDIVRGQGKNLKATIEGCAILFTGRARSEQ
jgi:hypothetical protein